MSGFNPFVNRAKRPLTVNGNSQIVSEGVLALEALNTATFAALFPDYDVDEVWISEIEIWENMPIRCNVSADGAPEWITWTGTRWIREEEAA